MEKEKEREVHSAPLSENSQSRTKSLLRRAVGYSKKAAIIAVATASFSTPAYATHKRMNNPSKTAETENYMNMPKYNFKSGITFFGMISKLDMAVKATKEKDRNGYGYAKILNADTDENYWYQVGLAFNIPNMKGGYKKGFNVIYMVFSPEGRRIMPDTDGAGILNVSKPIKQGDDLRFSIGFMDGQVVMTAKDLTNGGETAVNYTAAGGTKFIGAPYPNLPEYMVYNYICNRLGMFTGIMLERYEKEMPNYRRADMSSMQTNNIKGRQSGWTLITYCKDSDCGPNAKVLYRDQWLRETAKKDNKTSF